MSMRVGFGVTVLNKATATGGIDGIGTYTRELLKEFSKLNDSVDVHPFTVGINYPLHSSGEAVPYNLGNFRAQVLLSSVFGNAFLGSKKFTRNLDLIHATDHYIPRVKGCPLLATIMDAVPISHPEWVTSEFRKTKNFFWKKTAHWADKIITISEFSKQEVSKYFDLPLDMISSIPLGVDDKWFRKISGRQIEEVLAKYQLPGGHFLSIGTLQPRKNVGRSIEAYMSLPLSFRRDHPFVVVGRSGWGCQKLVESLEQNKYGNSVRWLSHLPEEELFALVKSAKALVFPTLFEGFGLPVLEAFAAGLPVISSNMSSIPEVAGDAAILIDPYNPEDIGSAMLEVVNDVDLFVDLSNKGFNRAKEFTWKRTALETLKLYSHVLDLN